MTEESKFHGSHRIDLRTVWKSSQPTVDEALQFSDLGLPALEYSNSYGRALRALAAEVRKQRTSLESARELIERVTSKFDMDAISSGHGGPGVNLALRQWLKEFERHGSQP